MSEGARSNFRSPFWSAFRWRRIFLCIESSQPDNDMREGRDMIPRLEYKWWMCKWNWWMTPRLSAIHSLGWETTPDWRQRNCMPTARPMLWPCVKYRVEGPGLVRDKPCWYCCVLQVVPLTPSGVVISITVDGEERSYWTCPQGSKATMVFEAAGKVRKRHQGPRAGYCTSPCNNTADISPLVPIQNSWMHNKWNKNICLSSEWILMKGELISLFFEWKDPDLQVSLLQSPDMSVMLKFYIWVGASNWHKLARAHGLASYVASSQ
jgi:hypothetical protein